MWPKGKTIDDSIINRFEQGGLYKLNGNSVLALTTSTINPCELWHIILSYVKYKSLPIVSNVVTCLPKIHINHEGVCKGYPQEKNTKNPFARSNSKEKGILDIVHSDVCGLMLDTSLSGYVYYVFFIDDYSCKTWIYFLKSKYEVFEKFKEFKGVVENLSGNNINTLRSENGGELLQMKSSTSVKKLGLIWILRHPIIPNIMEW